MPRQRSLSDVEQTAIAQFLIDTPGWTDQQYATHLKCTAAQVRYAREKADQGKLKVRQRTLDPAAMAAVTMQELDANEMMAEQCHQALAQLRADPDIAAKDRVAMLATIARTLRTAQETRLQNHMKATDAGIVFCLIRRFMPNATDEDCIKIYLEETERWRSLQST